MLLVAFLCEHYIKIAKNPFLNDIAFAWCERTLTCCVL